MQSARAEPAGRFQPDVAAESTALYLFTAAFADASFTSAFCRFSNLFFSFSASLA